MVYNFFFLKIMLLMRCCEKIRTAGYTTSDSTIGRIRTTCWVIKATGTH